MMFRLSSNLTRPSNMFCWISWSVSASATAGPRTRLETAPTARPLRIRNESGAIASPCEASNAPPAFFPVLLRGDRGESAPTGGGDRRRHLLQAKLWLGERPLSTRGAGPGFRQLLLMLENSKPGPVVVVQSVAPRALDVRVHEVLLHPVEQPREYRPVDEQVAGGLVISDRGGRRRRIRPGDELVQARVRVARP